MVKSEEALGMRDVSLVRDGRTIVTINEFSLKRGELVGVLGPNGAGKSSFLRIAALLEKPRRGEISLFGQTVSDSNVRALRRRCSMVMQKAHLVDETVEYNVSLPLVYRRIDGEEIKEKVGRWLGRFGVSHLLKRNALELSGGEAQRVSLARAFACEPDILLLDEPLSQLDQPTRSSLVAELGEVLKETGQTAVLVTHDREELLRFATGVVILDRGRVVQAGAVEDVFSAPATPGVAAFVGMDALLRGRVTAKDEELTLVCTGQWVFKVLGAYPEGADVRICVHPGDVVLAVPGDDRLSVDSFQNKLTCTVERVESQGGMAYVYLVPRRAGESEMLRALVTRHALRELKIEKGVDFLACVKSTVLHATLA